MTLHEPEVAAGPDPVYRDAGYVERPGLLDPGFCHYLCTYLALLGETGRLERDPVIPDAAFVYGDPAFDVLLDLLTPEVESHVGAALVPTYSFARIYGAGSSLYHHRDRPSCEHSLSVHLGSSGHPWPLSLIDLHGRQVDLIQSPGDAVAYQGMLLEHWRDPLPLGQHAQLFLHWVRADGPHAAQAFDGRDSLGVPSVLGDPVDAERS